MLLMEDSWIESNLRYILSEDLLVSCGGIRDNIALLIKASFFLTEVIIMWWIILLLFYVDIDIIVV